MTRLTDTAAALAVLTAGLGADTPVLLTAVLIAAVLVRAKETAPGAATSESGTVDKKSNHEYTPIMGVWKGNVKYALYG